MSLYHSNFDEFLLLIAVVLLASVLASKLSTRFGLPMLVVFLGIGMLLGSDGLGGINFDNSSLAQQAGVIALVFILFSGGLETSVKSLKPVLWSGLSLSTIGVLVSTAAVLLVCHYFLDFSWVQAALLGAMVSPTDAAAVFSVLRAKNSQPSSPTKAGDLLEEVELKSHIRPLLEFESGSNDPMAVFLTISLLQLAQQQHGSPWQAALPLVGHFVKQMTLGVGVGFLFGYLAVHLLNRAKLDFEGLYVSLTIGTVLCTFAFCQFLGGSGFLAVYVCGIVMAARNFVYRASLTAEHDALSWLMQISMFLLLGLLVFPSKLIHITGKGLFIAAFLVFVARPLSVFVALIGAKLGFKEKLFISWVGLRGAVPIVLATYPLLAGLDGAQFLFNVVFFVVLISVLIQGSTVMYVAKKLKMLIPLPPKVRYPLQLNNDLPFKENLIEIVVEPGSTACGQAVFNLALPESTLIVLIHRRGELFVPKGPTTLEPEDRLLTLAEPAGLQSLQSICKVS